jgi:hypothetical protein
MTFACARIDLSVSLPGENSILGTFPDLLNLRHRQDGSYGSLTNGLTFDMV